MGVIIACAARCTPEARIPTESDVGPISSVGSSHNRPTSAEDNEEDFWPCPAIGLVDGNDSRTNGREKTRPYILGLNAEALRPRFGNYIRKASR